MADGPIKIPTYLSKYVKPESIAATDNAASVSISIPRISIRGRKFRVVEGGEEIGKPKDELEVIILGISPAQGLFSKTFYSKGYTPGESSPPDCSSSNGIVPDSWVSNPVSAQCRNCKNFAFGSAISPNGKKVKACKDSKRLWCVLPKQPDGTLYLLQLASMSFKALAEYGNTLRQNGLPFSAVLTKLIMNENSEVPDVQFEIVSVLDEKTLTISMARAEKAEWDTPQAQPVLEAPKETPQLVQKVAKSKNPDDITTEEW